MAAVNRITKSIFSNIFSRSTTGYQSFSSFGPPSSLILRRGIASRLYVSGLSFYTTEKSLLDAFSQYGQVVQASVVMDKISSRSKGFGFVTYASEDEAEKAIAEMDRTTLHGRIITVELAKPRTERSSGMPIARGPPEPPTEQQ